MYVCSSLFIQQLLGPSASDHLMMAYRTGGSEHDVMHVLLMDSLFNHFFCYYKASLLFLTIYMFVADKRNIAWSRDTLSQTSFGTASQQLTPRTVLCAPYQSSERALAPVLTPRRSTFGQVRRQHLSV